MAKNRLIKTYESFMLNRKFKFEEEIIDPLLGLIRDNQVTLTQPDKLPQLSKLGYMYNHLWYAGRICWGYDGLLLDPEVKKAIKEYDHQDEPDEANNPYQYTSCEDNPKYKIEMCNPETDEIENLIYDAWSQHVGEGRESSPDYNEFVKIVKEGKPLTELEKKQLKVNKTFDDWVDIKLDPTYKYKSLYKDRKSVARYLLCTIGTGYGMNKDGFIIEESGGADVDKALYGDWQNAKFDPNIAQVVDRILAMPEVKETLDTAHKHISDIYKKEREKEAKEKKDFKDRIKAIKKKSGDVSDDDDISDEEMDEILNKLMAKHLDKGNDNEPYKKPYSKYYPISSSSIIYIIGSKEAQKREGINKIDKSYIDASIEICKDIMEHKDQEEKENVKFAQEFLGNMGVEGYSEFVKKPTFDKYELLREIREMFTDFTDEFGEELTQRVQANYDCWNIRLNDTAKDAYGDNNYFINIQFAKNPSLPIGASKSIDFLKGQLFYENLKNSLERIKTIPEIKLITFDYSNVPNGGMTTIDIGLYVNKYKHKLEEEKSDQDFIKQGFEVGGNSLILPIKGMNIVIRRPQPLGSTHPSNTSGKEYFSNALSFDIFTSDWKKLVNFQLDERHFNSIRGNIPTNEKSREVYDWVIKEHEAMKKSDPGYGFGKREGSKCLYAHDFMLWLKDHQENLK